MESEGEQSRGLPGRGSSWLGPGWKTGQRERRPWPSQGQGHDEPQVERAHSGRQVVWGTGPSYPLLGPTLLPEAGSRLSRVFLHKEKKWGCCQEHVCYHQRWLSESSALKCQEGRYSCPGWPLRPLLCARPCGPPAWWGRAASERVAWLLWPLWRPERLHFGSGLCLTALKLSVPVCKMGTQPSASVDNPGKATSLDCSLEPPLGLPGYTALPLCPAWAVSSHGHSCS